MNKNYIMFKELFILGTGIVAVNLIASHAYYHAEKMYLFEKAREYCLQVKKPLLNVGSGNNPAQVGDVNVDIFSPDKSIMPNYCQASIDNLPFQDKTFGAVTAFHIIEHVGDPKAALAELNRVADRIYASVPAPYDILTDSLLICHKHTFYYGDMEPNYPFVKALLVGSVLGGLGYLAYKEEYKL